MPGRVKALFSEEVESRNKTLDFQTLVVYTIVVNTIVRAAPQSLGMSGRSDLQKKNRDKGGCR